VFWMRTMDEYMAGSRLASIAPFFVGWERCGI
jgi:hypothetical protein